MLSRIHLHSRFQRLLWDTQIDHSGNIMMRDHFNSKIMWNHLRVISPRVEWCEVIWFKQSTSEIMVKWYPTAKPDCVFYNGILAWLAIQDQLITGDIMVKWYPTAKPDCVFYNGFMETKNYLFFECGYCRNAKIMIENYEIKI
ncbi:hypothetical protein YC2023_082405 [Brassica napus]